MNKYFLGVSFFIALPFFPTTYLANVNPVAYAEWVPSGVDLSNYRSCRWRGTAPICKGQCKDNEIQLATDSSGGGRKCATGSKAYCCVPK